MNQVARWAWVAVLGTALALSWWSLDTLARHYGMPPVFAAMVSTTFDGCSLVAADLAMKRAALADSAGAVKMLMLATVGLSAWLNYEHGALLHYPFAVRMLFASPAVISGSLFELQLRNMHRLRLRELDRIAQPLPSLGFLVWAMHPVAALRRVSQIAGSRLQSIPISVLDWTSSPPDTNTQPTGLRFEAPRSIESGAQPEPNIATPQPLPEHSSSPSQDVATDTAQGSAEQSPNHAKRPRLGGSSWTG